MGQFTQDGVVYEELPDGNVRVVGHAEAPAPAQGGGMVLGGANPKLSGEVALQQAALAKAARDAANAGSDKIKSDADARKAVADAAKAEREAAGSVPMTAVERAAAIAGYKSSEQLGKIITDLQAQYKVGPGATSGFAGLQDLIPDRFSETNAKFNNTGNSARGIVGSALGFTGGQLNTENEATKSVGPYLPQSSDYDSVIEQKIQTLKELQQTARERSIAQLGGVPDENGAITPIPKQSDQVAVPGAIPTPPGVDKSAAIPGNEGGQPPLALAQGSTRDETDPELSAALATLIRKGKTPDQINAYLSGVGAKPVDAGTVTQAQAYLKTHPSWNPANVSRTVPTTIGERFAASPLGAGVIGAADAGLAGFGDEVKGGISTGFGTMGDYTKARDAADAEKTVTAAANPLSSLAGNVVGGLGASILGGAGIQSTPLLAAGAARLGRFAAPVGEAAYGALYGAGENNDNRALGAAIGGGAGLVGNTLGSRLMRGVGRGLTGVRDGAVRALADRGVPMTGGQMLGGGWKSAEDKLMSVPIVGDAIANRRREGLQSFDRAALNEAGAPIGFTPADLGGEGLAQINGAKSRAYSAALDPVNVNLNEPQFIGDVGNAISTARAIPNDENAGQAALDALQYRIGSAAGVNGRLTGRGFQEAYRGLARTAKERAPRSYGHEVGGVMRDAQDALAGVLERQQPGAFDGFRAANATHRRTSILADALNAGKNQIGDDTNVLFTPAQLNTASVNGTRAFGGKMAAAEGNRPFADLAMAGQQVLPSKIPDSGTAGRLAMLALPGAVGGGAGAGAGYFGGDTQTGAGLGLGSAMSIAALNTPAGRRALEAMLLQRSAGSQRLGDALLAKSGLGGRAVTAAAVPLLGGY